MQRFGLKQKKTAKTECQESSGDFSDSCGPKKLRKNRNRRIIDNEARRIISLVMILVMLASAFCYAAEGDTFDSIKSNPEGWSTRSIGREPECEVAF